MLQKPRNVLLLNRTRRRKDSSISYAWRPGHPLKLLAFVKMLKAVLHNNLYPLLKLVQHHDTYTQGMRFGWWYHFVILPTLKLLVVWLLYQAVSNIQIKFCLNLRGHNEAGSGVTEITYLLNVTSAVQKIWPAFCHDIIKETSQARCFFKKLIGYTWSSTSSWKSTPIDIFAKYVKIQTTKSHFSQVFVQTSLCGQLMVHKLCKKKRLTK